MSKPGNAFWHCFPARLSDTKCPGMGHMVLAGVSLCFVLSAWMGTGAPFSMDSGALRTIKSLNSIVITQYTDCMSIFPVHPVFLPVGPKGLCRTEETEQLSNMPSVTQQEGN